MQLNTKVMCTVWVLIKIDAAACGLLAKLLIHSALGVVINDWLTAADHVSTTLSSCSSMMYALRMLQDHGMRPSSLHDVYHATVLVKILYCSLAGVVWPHQCYDIWCDMMVVITVVIAAGWTLIKFQHKFYPKLYSPSQFLSVPFLPPTFTFPHFPPSASSRTNIPLHARPRDGFGALWGKTEALMSHLTSPVFVLRVTFPKLQNENLNWEKPEPKTRKNDKFQCQGTTHHWGIRKVNIDNCKNQGFESRDNDIV